MYHRVTCHSSVCSEIREPGAGIRYLSRRPVSRGKAPRLEWAVGRPGGTAGPTVLVTGQIEDLVLSKLVWAKDSRSELQLCDVRNLLVESCGTAYLAPWARRLGVLELLEECRPCKTRARTWRPSTEGGWLR